MKNIIILPLLMFSVVNIALGNEDKYIGTMQKNIQAVYQALNQSECPDSYWGERKIQGSVLYAYDQGLDLRYIEMMQKNIQAVYQAQGIAEIQTVVNTFERIATAEKTKWEPFYYASFGYIMMATREQDKAKKDAYLDQAMKGITQAQKLAPAESEVVALEGFAYMIRVSVDPGARGQHYAPVAMQTLNKAVAMNNENPRAYALLGQMQYGTAEFFGSATTEACATLDKALEKFGTFASENPLAPRWGKGTAEAAKAQCK